MSDPLQKIKQKIQDELTALEHELSVDLPKEIAVAGRTATFRKMPSISSLKSGRDS